MVEAVKWYRMAAEQNHASAQNNLAVCYNKGQGVATDHVEGYKWWYLAVAHGNETAKNFPPCLLKNKMSQEQIAEAKRLARAFKPRVAPSTEGQ